MKKVVSCFLALACLFSLASCAKTEGEPNADGMPASVSQEEGEARSRRDAELLTEGMRLMNEPSDDLVIEAKDFSMSRALFENRVEAAMLTGKDRAEAEQYVLGYAVVQTMYHAALETAAVEIDQNDVCRRQAENRETIEALAALDDPNEGGHAAKVFFDTLVENGVDLEEYWALDLESWKVYETISAFTQLLYVNDYLGLGGSETDKAAWQQFCYEFVYRELMNAQNLRIASDLKWELTGDNYHADLWPEL